MTTHVPTDRVERVRPTIDPLVRNGAALAATSAVNGGLGYLFWLIAARSIPAAGVGTVTALVAALTVGSLLAGLGLGPALILLLPRTQSSSRWTALVVLGTSVAAVSGTIAGLVGAVLVPRLSSTMTIANPGTTTALLAAGTAMWTAALTLDAAFVAERRASLVLARFVIFAVVKLVVLGAFARWGSVDADLVFATWVLAIGVSLLSSLLHFLPKLGRLGPITRHDVVACMPSLRLPARGNYLVTLGGQLSAFGLPLVVIARSNATVNGWFSIAWMLITLLNAVSPAVAQALIAEGAHGRDLAATVGKGARVLAAVLVPGIVVMIVARSWLLGLFGAQYSDAATGLLVLLAVATLPDALSNLFVSAARVVQNYRRAITVNLTIAASSLVLCWFLVPPLGVAGAGWAWLGAQLIGASIAVAWMKSLLSTRVEVP